MSVVEVDQDAPSDERAGAYDLLEMGDASLTRLERAQIRLVRASLRPLPWWRPMALGPSTRHACRRLAKLMFLGAKISTQKI